MAVLHEQNLGPMILARRRRTGLTQQALADLSGLSVRTIRNLEQERTRPRRSSLALLLEALRLGAHEGDELRRAASQARIGGDG